MAEIVSGVIKPKGRIVNQFLEYIAPALAGADADMFLKISRILELDKIRMKNGDSGISKSDLEELLREEYTGDLPELRTMLEVTADKQRPGHPYRVTFSGIDLVVEGIQFRLYTDSNPIETLRDNNVNFAIASSDLMLAKFVSLLPENLDVSDPRAVLDNLPEDETTIQYAFPLNISHSRHMLIMNYRPESIASDESGLPILDEGTTIAVNGPYYLLYKFLFNGKYQFKEDQEVEPYVLRGKEARVGIEVVASGNTLKREVARTGSELAVFANPIYEGSGIVLVNDAKAEGRGLYGRITGLIREINQQISIPETTTDAYMRANLAGHLIGNRN